MLSRAIQGDVGIMEVVTANNCGLSPEYWAKVATDKIISVGGNAHPLIVDQANEFKAHIEVVVDYYIRQGIDSYRDTLVGQLKAQGHEDLAAIIRKV